MALNIKNREVEELVAKIAKRLRVSKTEAIRVVMKEKEAQIEESIEERRRALRKVLEEEVWPLVPPEVLGKTLTKEEVEELLGYGPYGV